MRNLTKYLISPIAGLAFVSVGTMTALMGPFGTFDTMTLLERAAYWYTLVGASLVISLILRRWVDLTLAHKNFWYRATLTGATFTLMFTPCIIGMNWFILGVEATEAMPIWKMYLVVAMVPLTLNPFIYFISRFYGGEEPTLGDLPLAVEMRPRLLDRLPDNLGDDLVRLSVQDHFVHVYLAEGSERLRMRFGDALNEVEGVPGLQVHRSHWVAHRAVTGHEQSGGKLVLRLKDGSTVPVSRNFRPEVEAAGLLMRQGDATGDAGQKQARRSA